MSSGPGLRERQAQLARDAMIDALLEALEAGEDEVPMNELARRAGVSRRTLYRYFGSREELTAAAAARLYDGEDALPTRVEGAADLVDNFRRSAAISSRRPALARALLATPEGKAVRERIMPERAASIEAAVAELWGGLSEEERRHALAIVRMLCSARSWVSLLDDQAIPPQEGVEAVAWALGVILDHLRSAGSTRAQTEQA